MHHKLLCHITHLSVGVPLAGTRPPGLEHGVAPGEGGRPPGLKHGAAPGVRGRPPGLECGAASVHLCTVRQFSLLRFVGFSSVRPVHASSPSARPSSTSKFVCFNRVLTDSVETFGAHRGAVGFQIPSGDHERYEHPAPIPGHPTSSISRPASTLARFGIHPSVVRHQPSGYSVLGTSPKSGIQHSTVRQVGLQGRPALTLIVQVLSQIRHSTFNRPASWPPRPSGINLDRSGPDAVRKDNQSVHPRPFAQDRAMYGQPQATRPPGHEQDRAFVQSRPPPKSQTRPSVRPRSHPFPSHNEDRSSTAERQERASKLSLPGCSIDRATLQGLRYEFWTTFPYDASMHHKLLCHITDLSVGVPLASTRPPGLEHGAAPGEGGCPPGLEHGAAPGVRGRPPGLECGAASVHLCTVRQFSLLRFVEFSSVRSVHASSPSARPSSTSEEEVQPVMHDSGDGECEQGHGECQEEGDGECEQGHGECQEEGDGECEQGHAECQEESDGECEQGHGECQEEGDGECQQGHVHLFFTF
ncbi:hypothetical protein LR48_Vigan10g253500 [Vigna angularis]|uniref:Uncharacterized protein n=1 Tax=Phaseolus angularis TaxID=3914 RepID=A0A0L9VNW3_PHAAN|nr:hypothetical protein LR48_Vigan10g253500 [Vigna angularis]